MSIITIPFSWLLTFFYNIFNNYGLALILFAFVVTLIRVPFDVKSKRSMAKTSLVTGKMNELKEKYKDNQQKLNEEMSKIYKEEGINPLSGCIWALVPLALVMILYFIVREPLTYMMGLDGDQISAITAYLEKMGETLTASAVGREIEIAQLIPGHIDGIRELVNAPDLIALDFNFLGMNLGKTPAWRFWESGWTGSDWGLFVLPILSMAFNYVSMKVNTLNSPQQMPDQAGSMKMMMRFMPLMSLWVGFTFPAALSIYWLSSNVFFTFFTFFTGRHFKKIQEAEMARREEKERLRQEELEAKRLETERLRKQNATTANPNTSKKRLQNTEKQRRQEYLSAQKADKAEDDEPSRNAHRRYARGRTYDPLRFARELEEAPENLDLASGESGVAQFDDGSTVSGETEDTAVQDGGNTDGAESGELGE